MKLVIERDGRIGDREFEAGRELRVGKDIESYAARAACTVGIGRLEREDTTKRRRGGEKRGRES